MPRPVSIAIILKAQTVAQAIGKHWSRVIGIQSRERRKPLFVIKESSVGSPSPGESAKGSHRALCVGVEEAALLHFVQHQQCALAQPPFQSEESCRSLAVEAQVAPIVLQ